MSDKLILNVEDAAGMLCCAPSTVRELSRRGTLPGIKFGEDWVFPLASFLTAVNSLAVAEQGSRGGRGGAQRPAAFATVEAGRRPSARARPLLNLEALSTERCAA
jgi:Helix-turn-helix domain